MAYLWRCPNCGEEVGLRKRVTQGKRSCSQCGNQITTAEIDRQQQERQDEYAQQQARQKASAQRTLLFAVGAIVCISVACNNFKVTPGETDKSTDPTTESERIQHQPAKPTEGEPIVKIEPQTVSETKSTKTIVNDDLTSSDEQESPPASSDWAQEISKPDEELIQHTITTMQDGNKDLAISQLQQLSAENPVPEDNEQATKLNSIGLRLLKQKQYEKASAWFAAAAQAEPKSSNFFSNLGFAQTYNGDLTHAKTNLFQSILLNPNREVAWNDLAIVFAKEHVQHKAVACFLIGLQVSNGKSQAFLKSLDKDPDVALRLAAAEALKRSVEQPSY